MAPSCVSKVYFIQKKRPELSGSTSGRGEWTPGFCRGRCRSQKLHSHLESDPTVRRQRHIFQRPSEHVIDVAGTLPDVLMDRASRDTEIFSSEVLTQSSMPLQPFMGKVKLDLVDVGRLWMLSTAVGWEKAQKFVTQLHFSSHAAPGLKRWRTPGTFCFHVMSSAAALVITGRDPRREHVTVTLQGGVGRPGYSYTV